MPIDNVFSKKFLTIKNSFLTSREEKQIYIVALLQKQKGTIMKFVFIGSGKMGTALASALVNSKMAPVDDVTAVDPLDKARDAFTKTTGIKCVPDAAGVASQADVLILAVKPQIAEKVVTSLPKLPKNPLVISICAGIPIRKLSAWFGSSRIIRVMPNTPLMVGKGASAFALGAAATDADAKIAGDLLSKSGFAAQVNEEQLDAVTGLSGSGPAYVFELAKALTMAGENVGLSPELSLALSLQTIAGAAEMLSRKIGSPDELRDAVTSPNGTTYAGLMVMQKRQFRDMIKETVEAATKRSEELGKA